MIIAVLQARVSSTRLPGKVLKPILGQPMLALEIERVLQAKKIDKLVVATSIEKSDDPLQLLCEELGVACFRGDLSHVLSRFYHAVEKLAPMHVVRLTGDCPLIDPEVIDQVISLHLRGNFDYSSNTLKPTFPDGLDVEVMRFSALEKAYQNARLPSELEHVTPFIHRHPEQFALGCYAHSVDLSSLRWTVDEADDFALVTWIYERLYEQNPRFKMNDILNLMAKNPEISRVNQQFERNAGMAKSLDADQVVLQQSGKE